MLSRFEVYGINTGHGSGQDFGQSSGQPYRHVDS